MKPIYILLAVSMSWAAAARAEVGVAKLSGTAEGSKITGTAVLEDTKSGLKLTAQIHGLAPGQHGFHIHEYGDCGDQAKNAGSHYNPTHAMHGDVLKAGLKHAHAGDMGNITADQNGDATVQVTIAKLSLTGGKHDAAGRALVVHEKADDFSQPAGNAGGRVACGVITVAPSDAAKK